LKQKRLFDISATLTGMLPLLPLLVRLKRGRPVFQLQSGVMDSFDFTMMVSGDK